MVLGEADLKQLLPGLIHRNRHYDEILDLNPGLLAAGNPTSSPRVKGWRAPG